MKKALRTDGLAWVLLSALLCAGAVVVTAMPAADANALDWQSALGLAEPWRLWTCAWVHWSVAHLLVNVLGGVVVAFVGWRARLPLASTVAWFVAWPLTQAMVAALGGERLVTAMPTYGGLSGVLHAGVVVLGLSLTWPRAAAGARPLVVPMPVPADTGFSATHSPPIEPSRITEGPWAMTEMGNSTAMPLSSLDQPPATDDVAPLPMPPERWIGMSILAGTLLKVAFEAPWNLAPRPSAALGMAVAPIAHAGGLAAGLLAWACMRLLTRWRD